MPPTEKLPFLRVVAIGLVLPILLSFIDSWLLSRELYAGREWASAQAMAIFVFQVGLYGVLCGRFIHPAWLRWLLFAWCLLFTDLTAASSFSPETAQSLFTAQIGLVTVWVVLGASSWKIRLPVALLLILPMLAHIAQTAALCLICLVLRSQRFRLALSEGDAWAEAYIAASSALGARPALPRKSAAIQFGIRDVLLWTTALAPLLAVARLSEGRMLTEGVLHAIVLVVALWAALGQGSSWLRWSLLAIFAVVAGIARADFDLYVARSWRFQYFATPTGWLSSDHVEYLLRRWDAITEFLLAGGMLAATLLIYLVLGYRLCRYVSSSPPIEAAKSNTTLHRTVETEVGQSKID
jgi:hypothetical protein